MYKQNAHLSQRNNVILDVISEHKWTINGSWPKSFYKYTLSQKTFHLWLAIILTYKIQLWQFLAEVLLRKLEIRWCFVFPSHLSSTSVLPCEIGNPEDSALVHCACNTVQLLQCPRLHLSWTMLPNSPELNALITRFREWYSSVSMSCESNILKRSSSWLNSGNALIRHLRKNVIFVFSHFTT